MNPLRLAWVHFRISAMNELQYRANFFIQLIHSAIALATGLIAIALVFSHTESLAGWSRHELLIVMGIHIALGGVIGTWIQPNMQRFMEDVSEGNLDFVLVKPVDAQALVSLREVRLWRLTDLVVGGVVVGVGATGLPDGIGWIQAAGFTTTVLIGALMIYCVWLIVSSIAFRVIKVDSVVELFQGIYEAGRWPVTIYPAWVRGSLTFIVPLAFAVTIPAETFSGRIGPEVILAAISGAAVLGTITRLIWRSNLKRYSGASA